MIILPFISVIDPLSGVPSTEHVKHIKKEGGATDRGHGGRDEANLWSKWIKYLNTEIINLPFIAVFVNHQKVRQEKRGRVDVEKKYNPGGLAQNFAATLQLRCSASKKQQISQAIQGDTYQEIWIECAKNSRGPTGNKTMVRKYAKRQSGGQTIFWWDWGRNTAETLGGLGPQHEARKVCNVVSHSNESYSCDRLGITEKTAISPSDLGDRIHCDAEIMKELADVFCWKQVKLFEPLSEEDQDTLEKQAVEARKKMMISEEK